MDAAWSALLSLQSSGAKLEAAARSREQVLAAMRSYMARLGLAVDALPPVVHVAGTKGKGSTCSMAESVLRAHGRRTGLFTSPHLIHVRERFRVDGRPVPEATFLEHFWAVWDGLQGSESPDAAVPQMASYFRFLTLVALRLFAAEGVDVLLLEVGIGGRLDATNVVERPLAAVVTTLDYDHVRTLGNTLEEIAGEKAGIFKRGCPALVAPQEPGPAAVLAAAAEAAGCPLAVVPPLAPGARLGLQGDFQRTNAALALAAARCALGDAAFDEARAAEGLASARWAGRAQVVEAAGGTRVWLDGAHTLRSMRCAAEWFTSSTGGVRPRVLLFNASHERDAWQLLAPLVACGFATAVFVPFDASRPSRVPLPTAEELLAAAPAGLEVQAAAGEAAPLPAVPDEGDDAALQWQRTLRDAWVGVGASPQAVVLPSIAAAVEWLCAAEVPVDVLATGSLYLVGGALSALGWSE